MNRNRLISDGGTVFVLLILIMLSILISEYRDSIFDYTVTENTQQAAAH